MRISFSPVGGYLDRRLELVKDGDRLRVNGIWHDFSSLPDGHRWEQDQLNVDLLDGPVRRRDGELELRFILPYGQAKDEAILFPKPIVVTEDGMVEAPGLFSRELGPDLGVGVVPETSVNEQTEMLESIMAAARQSINEVVESYARSKGYNDAASFASYVPSTVPNWAAEAKAFVEWRDAVWVTAYTKMAEVQAGAAVPTEEELLAMLPPAPEA